MGGGEGVDASSPYPISHLNLQLIPTEIQQRPLCIGLLVPPCLSLCSLAGDPFSERSAGGRARSEDRSARQGHAHH